MLNSSGLRRAELVSKRMAQSRLSPAGTALFSTLAQKGIVQVAPAAYRYCYLPENDREACGQEGVVDHLYRYWDALPTQEVRRSQGQGDPRHYLYPGLFATAPPHTL